MKRARTKPRTKRIAELVRELDEILEDDALVELQPAMERAKRALGVDRE